MQQAKVSTAPDDVDALVKAVHASPYLVVGDYRMPHTDDRQLVERLPGASRGISPILLATKSDISAKLALPDHTPNDFAEKPFFLREATQRSKRLIEGCKRCLLTLTRESDRCEKYFADGPVMHAAYGTLSEDAAVFKVPLLAFMSVSRGRWTPGNFETNFEATITEHSTTLKSPGLLMEGLHLLDEARRNAHRQGEQEEDVLSDS